MTLSVNQIDTIEWISFGTNILSLCGSLFIIANYLYHKELQNLAGKLVFMIAISDTIVEFASLFMTPPTDGLCTFQGIILQFGSISSVLWVGCISYTIYDIIVKKNIAISENQVWWYHMFIWSSTTVLTALPLTTSSYGESIGWCWVKEDDDIDSVWRIGTWYVILIVVILYSFYMYYRIYEEVGSNFVVQRMKFYPVILFVCYTPGFIFRLQKIKNNPSFTLGVIHAFLKGIYGFLNALIFALGTNVRRIWNKVCCCLPDPGSPRTLQHDNQSGISLSFVDDDNTSQSLEGADDSKEANVDLQVGTIHTNTMGNPLYVDSFSDLPSINKASSRDPSSTQKGEMRPEISYSVGFRQEKTETLSSAQLTEDPEALDSAK